MWPRGAPSRSASDPVIRSPDPAAVARFRAQTQALLGTPLGAARLALAVSGGADSMAMLALASAAFPGQVIAATIDHRLRAEAADEAAMVAGHCALLGVPHFILVPKTPIAGASIQARARDARYRLLADWVEEAGARALLTAHHADDQAETFLMRAARGSGITGLAAIRSQRDEDGLVVLRPLLGWRHAELRALAETTATPYVDDPSNSDPIYDRVRFRRLIETSPELNVAGLAAAAAHAADAERVLAEIAQTQWDARAVIGERTIELHIADLDRHFLRRHARRAIGALTAGEWHDAIDIEPLLDSLEQGAAATKAGVKATPRGSYWRFEPAPPRRSH